MVAARVIKTILTGDEVPYSWAWRNALGKCAGGFSISNEVQAVTHVPACHAKISITRYIAGCFRFFTLIQCF